MMHLIYWLAKLFRRFLINDRIISTLFTIPTKKRCNQIMVIYFIKLLRAVLLSGVYDRLCQLRWAQFDRCADIKFGLIAKVKCEFILDRKNIKICYTKRY